jgi:hypothetical protein
MVTAQSEADLVRPQIVAAVAKLRERGLSQMNAYAALGREVEKSPTWVRRIIGRSPDVAIRLRDALNVSAAYERLCARIEAAADAAEASNALLREELHAALGADSPALARTPGGTPAAGAAARSPGRTTAPALVRPDAAARVPGLPGAGDLTDLPLWRAATEED